MHAEIFMMIYELFPHDYYNFHIINMTDFMKASNDFKSFHIRIGQQMFLVWILVM